VEGKDSYRLRPCHARIRPCVLISGFGVMGWLGELARGQWVGQHVNRTALGRCGGCSLCFCHLCHGVYCILV